MNKFILAVVGVIVVGVGILLFSALFTVHQTQQALVLQFGNPIRVVQDPGLHVKIPLVQMSKLLTAASLIWIHQPKK